MNCILAESSANASCQCHAGTKILHAVPVQEVNVLHDHSDIPPQADSPNHSVWALAHRLFGFAFGVLTYCKSDWSCTLLQFIGNLLHESSKVFTLAENALKTSAQGQIQQFLFPGGIRKSEVAMLLQRSCRCHLRLLTGRGKFMGVHLLHKPL